MRSFLTANLSAARLWEFFYLLTALYLLLHPALVHPQSNAVVLGGGLVLLLLRSIPTGSFDDLGIFWVAFLSYVLFSSVWSISSGSTLQSVGFLFLGTLLYVMARQNEPSSQRRLENFILIFAAGAALLALYQRSFVFQEFAFLPTKLIGDEAKIVAAAVHDKRAFGPLTTSGALAALLIFSLPQSLIRAWTATGTKRILFGILSIILLGGLWATGSVGAWFCLALALLVLFWKQGLKLEAFVLFSFGFITALGVVWERGFHSWSQASFSMRLELWRSAWELFLQHPIWGSGLGTFGQAYQRAGFDLGMGSLFTHNLPLQLLTETGLAGSALFALAVFSVARRFKWPALWEGWGVLGGGLAVLLFSVLDLPFQMTELIWVFAAVAGRLELNPRKSLRIKAIPTECVQIGLLVVLGVTGFWPPFRPWNFALLAVSLWALAGYAQVRWNKMPLWVFLGVFYLALRAFNSPSAMGTVWFFEIAGLLLVFYLLLTQFLEPQKLLKLFLVLGLLWALKIWWVSFHYAQPGFNNWLHFQYSDVQAWMVFPNPKQIAIFLIPLVFILWKKPRTIWSVSAVVFSFLTMLRLKSFGALVGVGAGSMAVLVAIIKPRYRIWLGAAVLMAGIGLIFLRTLDPSPTKWERFGIWGSAVKVWERSPLVGVGPGAFAGYYDQVKTPRTSGISRYLMDARFTHNEFLEFLTAFGLVGFVWLLCFLIWMKPFGGDPQKRPAAVGLAAASFFDFCLHTPLIALEAVGLMTIRPEKPKKPSFFAAFLVLGLSLGLFGSAALVPFLQKHAEELKKDRQFPSAMRELGTATRLNAWDARVIAARSQLQEDLFLETKDPVWGRKANESYGIVLDLEQADGQWKFENAKRLTNRYVNGLGLGPEASAISAWADARHALPLNAFVFFENGLFDERLQPLKNEARSAKANRIIARFVLADYEDAVRLEPNFSAAWANLGLYHLKLAKIFNDPKEKMEGRRDIQKALEVYDQWKGVERIDPLEKQMVSLSPEILKILKKEMSR